MKKRTLVKLVLGFLIPGLLIISNSVSNAQTLQKLDEDNGYRIFII
jgi:hypothetical protein